MGQQLNLLDIDNDNNYITISEASKWASEYLNRSVTKSQISYLINYARVGSIKIDRKNHINLNELKNYYDNRSENEKNKILNGLSKDVNLSLSFSEYNEYERTKHVHRLHPYKGKFITQLVEYFLSNHTDGFKKEVFFKQGDIVLDPFAGSGTTLVQANELGIHSIGIELSSYNAIISRVKTESYEMDKMRQEGDRIIELLYHLKKETTAYYDELDKLIRLYNEKYFPSPKYRKAIHAKEINEKSYGKEVLGKFNFDYEKLLKKFNKIHPDKLFENKSHHSFLEYWLTEDIQKEIKVIKEIIELIKDEKLKYLFMVILGRAVRSCRATKHIDLATLTKPQFAPYYCERKHFKLCRPVNSLLSHFKKYYLDSIRRIKSFSMLKTNALNLVLEGDSYSIELDKVLEVKSFFNKAGKYKIDGIFTSPPYVGQIDYHEQHLYAYEIFNLPMKKDREIGILGLGKSKKARDQYSKGITKVFRNLKSYLKPYANCFIVANDRLQLYPDIINKSGYELVNEFKRPVLNRVEKDRRVYEESIFHIRPKS